MTESTREADDDEQSDREIARQFPAPSEQHFGDDRERERYGADERDLPRRPRPAENGHERLGDVLVASGSRIRDHGRQAYDERADGEEHAVDRPAISRSGLGRTQQVEVPGAAPRGVLRRRHDRTIIGAKRAGQGGGL
jgi:hypothetical protein